MTRRWLLGVGVLALAGAGFATAQQKAASPAGGTRPSVTVYKSPT